MRAQELMKLTELPEGVELHSDVDEEETLRRLQALSQMEAGDEEDEVQEVQEFYCGKADSSIASVDEESGSPAKQDDLEDQQTA